MAVAFNAVTSSSGIGSSVTFSHTTAGSDRQLYVVWGVVGSTNITGVTFDGTALAEKVDFEGEPGFRIFVFEWDIATNGQVPAKTADVVVTLASADGSSGGAISFTGVDQTTPSDTASTNSGGTGGTSNIVISSETDDMVLDIINAEDSTPTVGSGQTLRIDEAHADGGVGSSTEPGATSVTMSWTAIPDIFNHAAFNINASSGVTTVEPDAIASAETHGTPQINFGINPAAITSAEAHGTPTMLATIPVDPIASAEAFGTPVVVSLFTILADAIVSAEAFGVPLIQMFLNPDPVPSAEAFGAPILRCTIGVDSVASAEAFGELVIEMFLVPAGIASEEAFGNITVICVIHGFAGIPSEEAFGNLTMLLNISPLGIASLEAFGAPKIDFTILPDTVPSGEAFGLPVLGMTVNVDAVPSGEAFGTPTLNVVIGPLVGISSEETVNDIIAMISGRPPIQTPIRTGRPWWFDQVIGRRG